MSQALAPRDPEIAPAVVTPMAMIDRARDEPARIEATALEQRERLNAAVGKAPDALVGADGVARAA